MEPNEGAMVAVAFTLFCVAVALAVIGPWIGGRLLCWWGYHAIGITERVDEATVWGRCDRCGRGGALDSQGFLP